MAPQNHPRSKENGIETMQAKTIPGIPTICQSDTKIKAISPAMAPSVIPKLSPIPAMIGMRSARIRNAFLPIRVTISLMRYPGESPDMGMQIAQMIMNTSGTEP